MSIRFVSVLSHLQPSHSRPVFRESRVGASSLRSDGDLLNRVVLRFGRKRDEVDLSASVERGIEMNRFGVEEKMRGAEGVIGGRAEWADGTFEASSSKRRGDIDLS